LNFQAGGIVKVMNDRPLGAQEGELSLASQYIAATDGAAFRMMPERLVIKVLGDDRISFMHGMCSQDIKALKPGMVSYGLVLTERAHVVADFYVYAKEQELLLELDRGLWPAAKQQLEKLIVADDVEMVADETVQVLQIQGKAAKRAVENGFSDAVTIPEKSHYVIADSLILACFERFGCCGFTLLGEGDTLHDFMARLASRGTTRTAEVDATTFEIIRIENGIPRVGLDTDPKTIALEARLEPGISFAKGCYLGQETIERVSAHGQLKKRLFGLRVHGERTPERGAVVLLAGKEVGRVSSAALSPRLGPLALAILHHSAWTTNTEVTIEDSKGQLAAMVSDLPFG
jgi:folate-binding protein YgfZ